MIVGVDTSALLKLVADEAESRSLREHLAAGSPADSFCIGALAVTEMRRAAIRLGLDPDSVRPVIEPFTVVRLTDGILQLAGRFPAPELRTLDAIHVASALSVEAGAMLTYDHRQADAARAEGLEVRQPGA